MQIDLLKKVASAIAPKGGEEIIDVLYKKKNVNEFLISKKSSTIFLNVGRLICIQFYSNLCRVLFFIGLRQKIIYSFGDFQNAEDTVLRAALDAPLTGGRE